MCIEFGINKCATLKRGKVIQTEAIDLPAKGKIRSLDEDSEGYKYLGGIKVDDINHTEMKEIVGKEY